MEKTAEKTIKLNGKIDVTIKITRSITHIEGDAWEGRPAETLHIEDVEISFTHPSTGKRCTGNHLYILNSSCPYDKKNIENGAYASLGNTGLLLSKPSYDQLKKAYDEVSQNAMSPEWAEYISGEGEKMKKIEKETAIEIVESGNKEISSHGKLLTSVEIMAWRKNYNNAMNEGGEGYIPDRISQEDYDNAKKLLNDL